MRNYWSLLPAVLVIVVLILAYAVPTIINPQWTSSIMALFRTTGVPAGASPEEVRRAAGILGPQQRKSRRMLAIAMVVGALGLVGFNVSLNREANGCYQAARAFGAIDGRSAEDPCINMIYGAFFGDGSGKPDEENPQPVLYYQVVKDKKPKYLKWVQNAPKYDETQLLFGAVGKCSLDLKVEQLEDKIRATIDVDMPCPEDDDVALFPIKLKKPLGDRKIVTVDDKPITEINPDMDSWFTVVKKLATGG
ncbi:hypothetical protein [Kribbella sp. NPDC048915]|uniref:hypothetical protein n=1 Tax=Kribbella sp. NPDC048915 TaxID=3155148 RepID=UPI0033CA4609